MPLIVNWAELPLQIGLFEVNVVTFGKAETVIVPGSVTFDVQPTEDIV